MLAIKTEQLKLLYVCVLIKLKASTLCVLSVAE